METSANAPLAQPGRSRLRPQLKPLPGNGLALSLRYSFLPVRMEPGPSRITQPPVLRSDGPLGQLHHE